MKILLVMPFMAFDDSKYLGSSDSAFPIGLGYLAAALENAGHTVVVFDFQLKDNDIGAFEECLRRESFDVVGFSVTTVTRNSTLKLATFCKEISPNSKVVIGGAYPTIYQGSMLEGSGGSIDFELAGESEYSLVKLLEAVESNCGFEQVPGLTFCNGMTVCQTPRAELIQDLDTICFPAFHLFELHKYTPPPGMFFKRPLRNMITSRGCPFRCMFCDDRVIWQGRCRMRSAGNVVDEMELLVKRYGAREIQFYDDTFTVNKKRVLEICEEIIRRRLKVLWRCSSRVDTIDLEMLKLMKKAGCRSISYGIESGSDEILKKMNKGTTVAQARNAVEWTNRAGIQAKGFFMLNFPGETVETTEQTIRLAKELDLDFAGFSLTIPIHGERLKKYVLDHYEINEKVFYDPEASMGNEIYFYQPGLSEEYLREAYKRAAREFYLRPRYMVKMIMKIRNFYMLKSYVAGFMRLFKVRAK